jgi:hypothetical protein
MFKIITKKTWDKLQPNLELNSKLEEVLEKNKLIESKLANLAELQNKQDQESQEERGMCLSINFNCEKIEEVKIFSWNGKKYAGCLQINNGTNWQIVRKEILLELFGAISANAGKSVNITLINREKILKDGEEIFCLKAKKEKVKGE